MDPATLTSIIQAIVTVITTLSGVWAIFNKKNADLEEKLAVRMNNLEYQVRMSNINSSKNNELNGRVGPPYYYNDKMPD